MKKLTNILFFPILFVYFVGKIIASSLGIKDNPAVPVVFTLVVLLGIAAGVYVGVKPENPLADIAVPEGENPGVYYIPADDTNSVMSVTMLESALSQFYAKHKRMPKNFGDLQVSGIIKNLREPKPGYKFQLDLQWPEIIEVPLDTPPLKQATEADPTVVDEKSKLDAEGR